MTLRVVVADDERPARRFLLALLADFEEVELVGEASSGAQAIEVIEKTRPDLALLDLQMPEIDGLDVVRLIDRDHLPLVAFVTAFDEYAVQAFELNAVDYLLKPVNRARLSQTIQRVNERLEAEDSRGEQHEKLERVAARYDEQRPRGPLARLPVRKRGEIVIVPVSRIVSIESEGELLHIATTDDKRHTINGPLKDLEARLDEELFFRLSRSALVKVDHITSVSPMPGGSYVVNLSNGQKLSVSRQRSRVLRETLLRL